MHSGDEPVGLCDTGLPTRFLLSATALSKNKEAEGCEPVTAKRGASADRATLDYPRRLNRDATRPMKASGLKDVRAYGKAGSLAVSP